MFFHISPFFYHLHGNKYRCSFTCSSAIISSTVFPHIVLHQLLIMHITLANMGGVGNETTRNSHTHMHTHTRTHIHTHTHTHTPHTHTHTHSRTPRGTFYSLSPTSLPIAPSKESSSKLQTYRSKTSQALQVTWQGLLP